MAGLMFKPTVGGIVVYVKVVFRTDCVVISSRRRDQSDEDE